MGAALQTQGDYKGFGSVLIYSFSSTSIPQWLRDIPRWLCWKAEPKPGAPGKFGKVPVNPRTGATIGHNNPENHMTFDQALVEFAFAGPKTGIAGIGLSIPEGVAVIDLDNMIKDDGLISSEHREILETFKDCYTEFSPSGAGAHIFVRGSARTFAKHDLGIELYSITEGKGGQFMTVTGMTYQDRSGPEDGGPDCSNALLALCDKYGAKVKSMSGRPLPPIPAPEDVARTPEQLENEGVISPEWRAMIEHLGPPPSGSLRLIRDYGRPPAWGERAGPGDLVVQRFKALRAAAFYLARCRLPLWEAFAILSNSDYKLSEGAYDGRSGETWLWQYCFCSELEDGTRAVDVFARQAARASGESPFEDLSETEPGGWHNTNSVPKTSNSKERRTFTAQVIDASNVQDFTSRSLPPRPWLVKPLLLKGYVTVCLGPPGGGKSMFSMLLAVSLVSGLDLTGVGAPEAVCNVLVINNEDDGDEMQRRFQGVLLAHSIDQSKLRGKIYWQSGYERSYKLARGEGKEKTPAATEDAHEIARFCRDHDIGAVFMDPLVSLHDTNENDNAAIEKVAEIVRTVSANSGAAVHLVAHIRKQGGKDPEGHAGELEALRGASSMGGAVRAAYTVARMSEKHAKELKLEHRLAWSLMRIDLAKNNFSPRVEDALSWLEMRDYGLSNGCDRVGAPVPFDLAPYIAAATNKAESKAWLDRAAKLGQIVELLGGAPERPVADLLGALMKSWDVKKTKAREELDKLVPRGREHAEVALPGVLVWQETRGRGLVVCQHEEPDFEPADGV